MFIIIILFKPQKKSCGLIHSDKCCSPPLLSEAKAVGGTGWLCDLNNIQECAGACGQGDPGSGNTNGYGVPCVGGYDGNTGNLAGVDKSGHAAVDDGRIVMQQYH